MAKSGLCRSSATPKGWLSCPVRLGCLESCRIRRGRQMARRWFTRSRLTRRRRECLRCLAAIRVFAVSQRQFRFVVAGGRPFRGDGGHGTPNVRCDGRKRPDDLDSKGGQVTFPAWSPDGKAIAFGVGSYFTGHTKPAAVAMVNADGTGYRKVTEGPGNAGFPSWSPDGKRIVYRVAGSEQGLRILNLEDGKIITLTTEYDNFPAWSPKGDLIDFTSFRDGDFEIYTIRPDGSGVRVPALWAIRSPQHVQ